LINALNYQSLAFVQTVQGAVTDQCLYARLLDFFNWVKFQNVFSGAFVLGQICVCSFPILNRFHLKQHLKVFFIYKVCLIVGRSDANSNFEIVLVEVVSERLFK
jgi:hypothetical protein